MMPLDENESQAQRATDHVAVIYCTLCGHRCAHTAESGQVTIAWRMTPRGIRTMRRELAKMRCVYCQGTFELKVVRGAATP